MLPFGGFFGKKTGVFWYRLVFFVQKMSFFWKKKGGGLVYLGGCLHMHQGVKELLRATYTCKRAWCLHTLCHQMTRAFWWRASSMAAIFNAKSMVAGDFGLSVMHDWARRVMHSHAHPSACYDAGGLTNLCLAGIPAVNAVYVSPFGATVIIGMPTSLLQGLPWPNMCRAHLNQQLKTLNQCLAHGLEIL